MFDFDTQSLFLELTNFYFLFQESSKHQPMVANSDVNINNESSTSCMGNPTLGPPIDNASLSSSNTDSSKKSTDTLLI